MRFFKGSKQKKSFIPVILITGIFFLSLLILVLYPDCQARLVTLPGLLDKFYLLLAEKPANVFLSVTGTGVFFNNHRILYHGTLLNGFVPQTLYKKLTFFILVIFWLTRTPVKKKVVFSGIAVLLNLLLVSFHLATGALLAAKQIPTGDNELFPAASYAFAQFSLVTLLFIWIRNNRGLNLYFLSEYSKTDYFINKMKSLTGVIYLYIFLGSFVLPYFRFNPWIDFLFHASQKILTLLGYQASVQPSLLSGNNGSIYMAKACLGFKTILLFASVVYLTGNNTKSRWIYILSGFIFLNFVNIIRFVLLFIHIQKHGGYVLAMDLHDMYDYIIYTLVLILWIIWFEKYSDISGGKRKKAGKVLQKKR